jgi:LDH2 family malate/lactate/ureidoglycolate dehydrogenase
VEPAEGFESVIVPGDIEAENEERRRKEGIPLRDEDWQGVIDVAKRLGVDLATS